MLEPTHKKVKAHSSEHQFASASNSAMLTGYRCFYTVFENQCGLSYNVATLIIDELILRNNHQRLTKGFWFD